MAPSAPESPPPIRFWRRSDRNNDANPKNVQKRFKGRYSWHFEGKMCCRPDLSARLKEYEELCKQAESRFKNSLRELKEPMSPMEVVRSWDQCVRGFITDDAQLHGGGTFSIKFSAFEDV